VSSRKVVCGLIWALSAFTLLPRPVIADDGPKAPKDYRKVIIDQQSSWITASVERGTMDVSDLRPATTYAGADWIACLMTDAARKPRKWAVYIQEERIVHVREALAIDRCNAEVYAPLTPAPKSAESKPGR
jgi:hypothetical protein